MNVIFFQVGGIYWITFFFVTLATAEINHNAFGDNGSDKQNNCQEDEDRQQQSADDQQRQSDDQGEH